jgi:hypothetical protein
MARDDLTHPVAAAATVQDKLCPYDEEEPHIWFRLIEAQFAAAGIRSQKLKYANALASLPKQVLRDILDILDVCNDSDEPFDCLKDTLLGQFGKSKWQSYFELLRLPMEMQGLKKAQYSHGEAQATSPSRSLTRHRPFPCNVSYSPTALHAKSSRSWQPQDGRSHGEGCGCPVGCSRRPQPHSRSHLDSAQ